MSAGGNANVRELFAPLLAARSLCPVSYTHLDVYKRQVLINPAVMAPVLLGGLVGNQTNFHSGETFTFTDEHVEQLRALEVACVTPARYLLLVEAGDEVLDYRLAVAHYVGSRQIVLAGGDHSFTRFPDMLSQILEFCGL